MASKWADLNRVDFNEIKSGVMTIGAPQIDRDSLVSAPILLHGRPVSVVSSYKHLGVKFNDTLSLKLIVADRVNICRSLLNSFRHILTASSISLPLKLD